MTAPLLIVTGTCCTWWDTIDKAARTSDQGNGIRLPCCPHCGSVLYQYEPEKWWSGIDAYEAKKPEPGYRQMIEWMQGRCFPNFAAAKSAFQRAHTQ